MKFDINKIKLGSSKEPNLEKRLTDEYMGSLKTVGEGPQVNAELEGGEYLQLPTGEIKKSEGEKHEKGGIKMHIPDMTKILSNRLKLSAKDVKAIKEEFDLKLTTKTTYAKALERFDKKIGFQDALEDQEKHIKGLKKQIDDKKMDSGTKMLNHQHLSKKIYDSEKDKKELQARRGLFFNFVFNLQEAGKSDTRKEMPKKGNFRYGGMKTPVMKFNLGGINVINTYPNGGEEPISQSERNLWYMKANLTPEEISYFKSGLIDLTTPKGDWTKGVMNDQSMFPNVSPALQQKKKMSLINARDKAERAFKESEACRRGDLECQEAFGEFNQSMFNKWANPCGTNPNDPNCVPEDIALKVEKRLDDAFKTEKLPTYREAYKEVDKKRYPTYESFVADAKYWDKYKKAMPKDELDRIIEESSPARVAPIIAPPSGPIVTESVESRTKTTTPSIPSTSESVVAEPTVQTHFKWDVVGTLPDGSPQYKKVYTTADDPNAIPIQGKSTKKYSNGGLTGSQFKKLLNKFGISEDRGRQILQNFDEGGRFNELKNKSDLSYDDIRLAYENGEITLQEVSQLQATLGGGTPSVEIMFNPSFDLTRSRFADLPAEKQKKGSTAFGSITKDNIEEVMLSLYRNFPDIVSSPKVFGVTYKDGKVDWDRSLDFSKVSSKVEQFQRLANKRMISSANTIVNNPNMFSESQIKAANDFLEKETFLDEAGKVRSYDSKLGQFTSGRFNIGMDLVNPEELETLQSNGIFTVKKLQEELEKNPELISDNSKARLEKLVEVMDEDSDYALTDYTIPVEEEQEEDEKVDSKDIVDDINIPLKKRIPSYFNIPDYSPLPPSGLLGTFMPTSRFTEIDPVRIGIEQQIQTSADAMRVMGDQIKDLPPQQRAIVLAQFQAERGNQLNKAAYDANVWNAQNLQNVEMYNAGQKDRMSEADKADKLGYEMRTYTGLAKQEEEWKNFYDDAIRRAMNKEMIKSSLGILSSIYPDVNVNPNLDDIIYDPSEVFAIQDSGNFGALFGNPFV
jgi:regulator of RNase E activity RraB